jgi:hypothetical protein
MNGVIDLQRPPAERPRIDYRSVFAWMPVNTADEGWVWMRRAWKITVGDDCLFSCSVLPI